MAYRKIYIALDCKDAEEAQQVQKAAEQLSATFGMSAKDILDIYPSVMKNAGLIKTTIRTLSKEGFRGIGKVVASLMTNLKK